MKIFFKCFFSLIILIVLAFSAVQYKKYSVEKSVVQYLANEENISQHDILSINPFIANLPGDRNWLVSVKLKNDPKTYYYFRHKGQVILESYTENSKNHVMYDASK